MLTKADEGGRGGCRTPVFGWRNMWTAPKRCDYNFKIGAFRKYLCRTLGNSWWPLSDPIESIHMLLWSFFVSLTGLWYHNIGAASGKVHQHYDIYLHHKVEQINPRHTVERLFLSVFSSEYCFLLPQYFRCIFDTSSFLRQIRQIIIIYGMKRFLTKKIYP